MNCNYCTLKWIKRRLKKGERIVKRNSPFMGGIDIFVLKKGEEMPSSYRGPCDELPNGDKWYDSHHKAWFMELSDHCVC